MEIFEEYYFGLPYNQRDVIAKLAKGLDYFDLCEALDEWFSVAFCSLDRGYDKLEERERVVVLCKELLQIALAASEENFVDWVAYAALRKVFRDKYTLVFVRCEVFRLFNAVATYKGPIEFTRANIGITYVLIMTVVELTYLVDNI